MNKFNYLQGNGKYMINTNFKTINNNIREDFTITSAEITINNISTIKTSDIILITTAELPAFTPNIIGGLLSSQLESMKTDQIFNEF